METKFIEVVSVVGEQKLNWGKFVVGRFEAHEWLRRTVEGGDGSLIARTGWTDQHFVVFDLETGEGAFFLCKPSGSPKHDLLKHRVWVCPLFQPFLGWLYKQNLTDLQELPSSVQFDAKDAPFEMAGHRRPGPPGVLKIDPNRVDWMLKALSDVNGFASDMAREVALSRRELVEVLLLAACDACPEDEMSEPEFVDLAHRVFNTKLVRR